MPATTATDASAAKPVVAEEKGKALDPEVLAKYRVRLEEERAAAIRTIGSLGVSLSQELGETYGSEWGDQGRRADDQQVLTNQRDRAEVRLADIEQALKEIDTGRYGLCQSCGDQIPLERLEALPQTALCNGTKLPGCRPVVRKGHDKLKPDRWH